jgi:hypothetical protein
MQLALLIVALICCLIASVYPPQSPPVRVHLGWLGMALYFLTLILGHAR